MRTRRNSAMIRAVVIGGILVILIITLGTVFTGRRASRDSEDAVHSVSLFYLYELAGRREQVVASNLDGNIEKIQTAVSLLTEEDLSDPEHLQAFQSRMKMLFSLEKFAFVDSNGLIYTSLGTQDDIDKYNFDYTSISKPEISIKNIDSYEKKAIIAVPVDRIPFNGQTFIVCFMEIDMARMLAGVSLQSDENNTTFCNIYTGDGYSLANNVLGGLASERNLLAAMANAKIEEGYSLDKMTADFANHEEGVIAFNYNDIQATLCYIPVENTDWMLTYLIRESVISDQISSVSKGIIRRSLIQSILTAMVLIGMFAVVIAQTMRSQKLLIEKEKSDAANKVKQEELSQRLKLQELLLEQEKQKTQQDNLITAMAADYWSVYYIDLDENEGVCYQSHPEVENGFIPGQKFRYFESFTAYAEKYITKNGRKEFLKFANPDSIREGLKNNRVISYRYMVSRKGRESYETVRFARVRRPGEGDDSAVRYVGASFTDVDEETRRSMAQNQALSDALTAAEEASKAKTAFLSNMSHEIRTPMNAIIGLDNIALSDKTLSAETREYLEKISGSAQHLLNLINDILDMSRIESGRMTLKNEEFSFSGMIEQINTIFSEQCRDKNLSYNCRVNGHLDDSYIGDSGKLKQVLINILGNAVKFTPEGGSVDFIVEKTAAFDSKTTLRFIVKDTGIGMSEEFLPKLFDTFSQENSSSTNKYGSTGLGMAITKNIVDMMNGVIAVESEKNKGTTFTVTITLMDSERKQTKGEISEVHPGDLNVLVIDDDPVALEHARLVLEEVGISSECADSGARALEMVRLRHARREPYNLILADWKMPEMDGIETARHIRECIGDESAIILLTAYKWDEVLDEAAAAGIDGFIAKPLFASNVIERFNEALKKKKIVSENSSGHTDLKGKRVLLAEDVQVNAEIMIMLLSMREMEVDHAENGKIALDMFAQSPEGWYDVILMDMRMPEMDGLEATARIRALNRPDAAGIPIIALTANAFDEDVQRSLQAGLNAHLTKPVSPEILYKTLENMIK